MRRSAGGGRPKAKKGGIAAGQLHTVAFRADGKVLATGNNDFGQCDVSSWSDVVGVACGKDFTVAVRADGTALAAGNNQIAMSAREGIGVHHHAGRLLPGYVSPMKLGQPVRKARFSVFQKGDFIRAGNLIKAQILKKARRLGLCIQKEARCSMMFGHILIWKQDMSIILQHL